MRPTKRTVRRLVAAILTAAIPTVGLVLPASAASTATVKISDVSVISTGTTTINAVFTISLTTPKGSATVGWKTVAGTATAGVDYIAASGQVSLSKSAKSAQVTVKVLGHVLYEANETFFVKLTRVSGAPISKDTGVGTIINNDPAPVVSVADLTVDESAGTADVTVSLAGATELPASVGYATGGGTAIAGTDYTATSGTLLIDPGTSSGIVSVPITDNTVHEPDRTFEVTLSSPTDATLGVAVALVTIADDDPVPSISVADVVVGEADGTASFPVTLSNPSAWTITVAYATVDGTAFAVEDYTATSGTLTFNPGETATSVPVGVIDDAISEPTQTFDLTLTNATNATIERATGTASIIDDDGDPWVSVADVSVAGNAGQATFTVRVDRPSSSEITVGYVTVDGTAFAGSDYTLTTGTASFPAGTLTADVSVPILNDPAYGSSKTFGLVLSAPTNVNIDTLQATGTITSGRKAPAKLTLGVKKTVKAVVARGLITYAVPGMQIRVALMRYTAGHWVRKARKAVTVKGIRDRNGDGVLEAAYAASFSRPTHGKYRFVARYAGASTILACVASKSFKV